MDSKLESFNSIHEKAPELNNDIYIRLGKALVKLCMQDGEEASRVLSVKLSGVNSHLNQLKNQISSHSDATALTAGVDLALAELVDAFMQLQFFDRVSQRMDHAIQSLDISLEPEQKYLTIEKKFTMEDERVLYNALLEGDEVDAAVLKANSRLDMTLDKSEGDDIELF